MVFVLNIKDYKDKKWFRFIDELFHRIKNDEVTAIGAQITYYLILSIFPFLIFFLNLLSYTSIAQQDVLNNFLIVLPTEAQTLIKNIVAEIVGSSSQALLSVGIILTIWTGSAGITSIIRAVNKAYGVEKKRPFWKTKGLAIIFTIVLAFLLILVLSMLVFGELIANKLLLQFDFLDVFKPLWHVVRIVTPLVSMVIIFTLLYKMSPTPRNGSHIKFKHALPGAIFTSVGWVVASTIFSYYVNNFGKYSKTYGSLGGIIVLLLWLYITSIMIVLGGEVNGTYAYMKRTSNVNDDADDEI